MTKDYPITEVALSAEQAAEMQAAIAAYLEREGLLVTGKEIDEWLVFAPRRGIHDKSELKRILLSMKAEDAREIMYIIDMLGEPDYD
ncbi:MAG: hypothetical protein ABWZ74_06800 [Hyphomicrobiaceae bacterium]